MQIRSINWDLGAPSLPHSVSLSVQTLDNGMMVYSPRVHAFASRQELALLEHVGDLKHSRVALRIHQALGKTQIDPLPELCVVGWGACDIMIILLSPVQHVLGKCTNCVGTVCLYFGVMGQSKNSPSDILGHIEMTDFFHRCITRASGVALQ